MSTHSSFGFRRVAGAASALLALAMSCAASANPSIARNVYEDGAIYVVRAGLGIATTLELDPEDPVVDFSAGFSSGWDIVRRDTLFYLKPKNIDVDTNLLVRTRNRSYIFELQVVAADWKRLDEARRSGVQYRVVFDYPVLPDAQEGAGVDSEQAVETEGSPDARRSEHFAYEVSTRTNRAWLVPSSIHDDGRFTYIRLPVPDNIPSGNWPTVFARNSRHDDDFVVNSNVDGDRIVVHGIYPFLVLRHGKDVIGIRRSTDE